MTIKRTGLGKNLSALLGNAPNIMVEKQKPDTGLVQLPIHFLKPGKYQPRGEIDESSLEELAQSIRQQGLLQPVIVRKTEEDGYEILAGERRWRASKIAGLKDIPVIVREVDDKTAMAIALIENLQREDLNPMDQARAMQRLINEFTLTHQQIADLLNKSRTAVSNFLRLMTLDVEVIRLLENADLDMGHARTLLGLDIHLQAEVARQVVARELSVRETEKLVNRMKKGLSPHPPKAMVPCAYDDQIIQLSEKLNTRIALKQGKGGKGHLVIHYENNQSLENVLRWFS